MAENVTDWSIVGMLGGMFFITSARYAKTIQEFEWDSEAEYAEHDIYGGTTQLEFVGCKADEISIEIKLSAYFGVNPIRDIVTLLGYERSGKALELVLGEKSYGKCKWVIKKSKRVGNVYDGNGNLTEAIYSINLKAYED